MISCKVGEPTVQEANVLQSSWYVPCNMHLKIVYGHEESLKKEPA